MVLDCCFFRVFRGSIFELTGEKLRLPDDMLVGAVVGMRLVYATTPACKGTCLFQTYEFSDLIFNT